RHPRLPWRYEGQYPGLRDGSVLPSTFYRLPKAELNVRTAVLGLDWTDDALVVHGTAEIAHLPSSPDTEIRVALAWGNHTRSLPVERVTEPDTHGENRPVGFVTRIPRTLLASLPAWVTSAHLAVEVRTAGIRRSGPLAPGGLQYPVGAWIGDVWLQPVRSTDGKITLQFRRNAVQLTGAAVAGDDLVLTGRLPSRLTAPELRLSRSAGDIRVPLHRNRQTTMDGFTARVPLDDLIDEMEPDDPFLGRTVLVPRLHDGKEELLLLITGLDHGVLAPRRDRVITVSRSPGMYLNLIEGPARVTADDIVATTDGSTLTVSGPRWAGVDYDRIAWRRFLANSDDGIDAPVRVTLDDDRWTATTALADLSDVADEDLNWTLFAAPADSPPYAVQTDAFLLSRLPLRPGRLVMRARSGILHLETD
ncbi:MAG: hypothetical protein ABW046_22795, partial [Actinoplanes sp.]